VLAGFIGNVEASGGIRCIIDQKLDSKRPQGRAGER